MTEKKKVDEPLLSIRMYLLIKAMERGAPFHIAWEAVSSTLLDIGTTDPNLRYYEQWEALHERGVKRRASTTQSK